MQSSEAERRVREAESMRTALTQSVWPRRVWRELFSKFQIMIVWSMEPVARIEPVDVLASCIELRRLERTIKMEADNTVTMTRICR